MKTKIAAMLAGSSLLAFVSPALAQTATTAPATTAAADDQAAPEDEEIVVTGTFIRGIAPTGANVLGLNKTDVQASGATSTDQLLATIPQITNMFNQVTSAGQFGNNGTAGGALNINSAIQINRPTLRNLTSNTASGSSTLVLVDGHRVVGAGVNQSVPDPDIVPPGAIERVEIITDGGSSLYGADAVGGVINFITRRNFDGVGVDGHYSFGDSYSSYDANLTAGKSWGTGSLFASLNFARKNAIFGRDRDYIQSLQWSAPGGPIPNSINCAPGNAVVGANIYPVQISGSTVTLGPAGNGNRCDATDNESIAPDEDRIGFGVGFTQNLNDDVKFDLRGFYAYRDTTSYSGALGAIPAQSAVATVTSSNPNYVPRFVGDTATQTVRFNFGPVNGFEAAEAHTRLEEWGFTPTLTVSLPKNWQANFMLNHGESNTYYNNASWDVTGGPNGIQTLVTAGLLNPYNIASSDPTALTNVLNQQSYGDGRETMSNARAVFDGSLFSLPAGEVRAAFGAEYLSETYSTRAGFSVIDGQGTLPLSSYDRNTSAAFLELNIPLVGPDMNIPLVHSLSLSASGRYDKYSDFGVTKNPRFAITYEPLDWISLRGSWSTSFQAPTLVDQNGSQAKTAIPIVPGPSNFLFPEDPANGHTSAPGQVVLIPGALVGSFPNLKPQEATIWSAGFDISPPILEGLEFSATYYNIEFSNLLGRPPFFNQTNLLRNFRNVITYTPTAADVLALQNVSTNPAQLQPYVTDPTQVFAIVDARLQNLGVERDSGLDFATRYTHDTSFGSIEAGFSGNYLIRTTRAPSSSAAFTKSDLDLGAPRFFYSANIGATWGDLYGRATWHHNGGYNVTRTATLPQDDVDAFDTVDLYFRYNLGNLGVAKDLGVTLNINNAFDESPPLYKADGGTGIANGSTLGRVFQIGFNSHF